MGVKITGEYIGEKKVKLVHEQSGAELITVAPLDNNGDGSSFSPTDLCAAALGACMMTIIGIIAERDDVNVSGMRMEVEKTMSSGSPRRIAALPLSIHLPSALTQEQRNKFEQGAKACPVHHSLHIEIEAPVSFLYDL